MTYLGHHLSTEETMRIALRPCPPFTVAISEEDKSNVQLAQLLLASATKVHIQQYDRARTLLNECKLLSSRLGNSVQRVVHYFTFALQDKIEQETKKTTTTMSDAPNTTRKQPLYEEVTKVDPALVAVFQELPFCQITGLAGIQAVVESVSSFKKVHLIDLQMGFGMRCIALMQALANRIELLKLTVIKTCHRENIEETGKRLSDFAETLNLPFSFKVVSTVAANAIEELSKDSFDLEEEEAVVVYSQLFLREIALRPNGLETLIRVISSLKPRIMVVKEVEANHHSTEAAANFRELFQEVLFFYSALFDVLEGSMERQDRNRIKVESIYLGKEIKDILTTRVVSNMKLDQWREVFRGFGMVEKELSRSSLYQAELVAKRFACGSCCTLERNGKSFTAGWKGTPLLSVSAWEFHLEEKIAENWNS